MHNYYNKLNEVRSSTGRTPRPARLAAARVPSEPRWRTAAQLRTRAPTCAAQTTRMKQLPLILACSFEFSEIPIGPPSAPTGTALLRAGCTRSHT